MLGAVGISTILEDVVGKLTHGIKVFAAVFSIGCICREANRKLAEKQYDEHEPP
jgi:hypothetical protein